MQDAAVPKVQIAPGIHRGQAPGLSGGSHWAARLIPLLAFIAIVGFAAFWYWPALLGEQSGNIPIVFSIVLSIFLSLLPAMICVVQNITKKRQQNRLTSVGRFPVGRTMYFQSALTTVDALKMGGVDSDYEAPLFVYFLVLFVGFIAILLGFYFAPLFAEPTVLLGGLKTPTDADYRTYQMQTFAVLAMAFLASYVYSLGRLLDRVNNNDLYPISLYYYASRVIIACVVAAVMRHTADVFGVSSSAMLLLLGFAIGFAPDLFVLAITRHAFQTLKIWGSRDDPSATTRPTSLPLLVIDDLTREKIDRLNELGIDSAQTLARQNPFLLLPRLPYDLGLIVDWIGQAQLYALVRDEKLQLLRAMMIRDAFDLYIRLQDENARPEVTQALGISAPAALTLMSQLDQDQSFARLRQVRVAMLPAAANDGSRSLDAATSEGRDEP
jgi:hypothetical protein